MRGTQQSFRSRGGFTLIEMIVVVLIIMVLIGILVPVLSYAKKMASETATQNTLQVIASGIDKYHDDFAMDPPSDVGLMSSSLPPNRGSVMLAQGLEGYLADDRDGAGTGSPMDPPYGFRVTKAGQGRMYGPYVPPESKVLRQDPNVSLAQYFVDVWGHEIIYYRAVPSSINGSPRTISQVFASSGTPFSGVFVINDNTAVIDPYTTAPGQSPLAIGNPGASSAKPFYVKLGVKAGTNNVSPGDVVGGRDSYLLISAGYDGKFFTADDIISVRK